MKNKVINSKFQVINNKTQRNLLLSPLPLIFLLPATYGWEMRQVSSIKLSLQKKLTSFRVV
jgi:hypothetical protein